MAEWKAFYFLGDIFPTNLFYCQHVSLYPKTVVLLKLITLFTFHHNVLLSIETLQKIYTTQIDFMKRVRYNNR